MRKDREWKGDREGKCGEREGEGKERVDEEGEVEGRRMEEGGSEKLQEVRVEEMSGKGRWMREFEEVHTYI